MLTPLFARNVKWCLGRRSGLRSLCISYDFVCPGCTAGPRNRVAPIQLDKEIIEVVDSFCYLEDVLSTEGGVERTIQARTAAAWKKWKDLAGLLINRHVPMRSRGKVFNSCICPFLLYGMETWSLTKILEDTLQSCDHCMLR